MKSIVSKSRWWLARLGAHCRATLSRNDTFEILLGAASTTLPGLLAKLTYLRAVAASNESWMLDEQEGASLALIDSFTASLKNIGAQS